jgi:hypothetical protein
MSDYSTARTAIYNAIHAVPSIGIVHYYQRYNSDWTAYLGHFKTTIASKDQIRGWWLSRQTVDGTYDQFNKVNRVHQFVIHGILGLQDAADTDATFGGLVDAVMDALDPVTISGFWSCGPTQVRVYEVRQFGSVLCHYCEIAYPCEKAG